MLPTFARLYFWGVHGMFGEVVFTAVWEYIVTGALHLKGFSSLWSFCNYGFGTLLAESLHEFLVALRMPFVIRLILYVLVAYSWEFTAGLILRQYDACPWDYTEFEYDFMGLITLEYAPAWLGAAVYFEWLYGYMKGVDERASWKKNLTYDHYSHPLLRKIGITPLGHDNDSKHPS